MVNSQGPLFHAGRAWPSSPPQLHFASSSDLSVVGAPADGPLAESGFSLHPPLRPGDPTPLVHSVPRGSGRRRARVLPARLAASVLSSSPSCKPCRFAHSSARYFYRLGSARPPLSFWVIVLLALLTPSDSESQFSLTLAFLSTLQSPLIRPLQPRRFAVQGQSLRGHQPAAAGAPAAASGGCVIPPAPRPEYAGAAFCRPVLAYEYRRIRDRPTGEPAVYK